MKKEGAYVGVWLLRSSIDLESSFRSSPLEGIKSLPFSLKHARSRFPPTLINLGLIRVLRIHKVSNFMDC